MENYPVDRVYCGWFGCDYATQHETMTWIVKDCGVALFALALLLYLVFRQWRLLPGPLALGALCVLFGLWGQFLFIFTLFAMMSTALLLAAGFMKVLAEWPGALYQRREPRRATRRQRRP